MIGIDALKVLNIDLEIDLVDLYSHARILRNRVNAVRVGEKHDRLIVSKILENTSFRIFPQEGGKVIFTNPNETPNRLYTLPRFIWFCSGESLSIGWVANNRIDVQNKDFKRFLKERTSNQITELKKEEVA